MTLDSQLRDLDAASGQPDARRRARGASLVDRIVHDEPARPRASRRAVAWRVGGVVAAGALIATGALVLPGLTPTLPAVASWTPEAGPVSAADLVVAEDACRAQLAGSSSAIGADAPVVLAERRGDIVGLVLWQANPEAQGSCIVELPEGASQSEGVVSGVGGSSGPAFEAVPGAFTEGAISQFAVADGTASMTSGSVGEGVVGVRLHADGITTDATVAGGRFVAWWPGAAFDDTDQPSGQGGPEPIISYDMTLADGTVIVDAEPWFPGR